MTGCDLLGNAELTLSVVTYSNQAAWYPTTLLWFRCANTLTSLNTYWQDKLNITAHVNVFLLDITRQAGSKKCSLFLYCAFQTHANSKVKSLTIGYVFRFCQSKLPQNKKTKWMKIYQSHSTDMTFWTHWGKPLFQERSVRMIERKKVDIGLHFLLKSSHVVEKCINKSHPLQHIVIKSACLKGKSIYTNIWAER